MATGKRFYWIKLKDSFMTSDSVDFLMGQPGGANYVVLYQMLCLKTINTGGKLERKIGEVIIPYDEAKIQRDMKWFSIDTVRIALNLYKALGLVYTDQNGVLALADYENLVGSETDWAAKRRLQRSGNAFPEIPSGDNVPTNVPTNVPIEIENRDKRLDKENREIDIEPEIVGNISDSDESDCYAAAQRVVDAWNLLPVESKVHRMSATSTRAKSLRARIREYGEEKVMIAVAMVQNSDFLLGKKTDFQITFDWFVKPDNFTKVISGNYNNRSQKSAESSPVENLKALHAMFREEETDDQV